MVDNIQKLNDNSLMSEIFYSEEQYREYQDELAGDGYKNEYQRVAAQSRFENPVRNETETARRMTEGGKSVILVSYPRYCPSTDGLLGCETVVDEVYDTLAEAEAALAALYTEL